MELRIDPLSAAAFATFGDVIATPDAKGVPANEDTALRFDDVARLELDRDGGRPCLSLFRAQPASLPLECSRLERHPLSSQAFVPVGAARFLVVVAPPGGDAPDAARTRAFLAAGGQGVNYHCGVWHHPVLALDRETDFVVIGRAGSTDCDIAPFAGGEVVCVGLIPG
ncbi:MAG: ureidoglycolate lyase [Rhodospirillales bacterium]|jgi:ureidoglycolate lyase|nr:ureidoglycolate lyase [Rhodospirillales bacterium]